MNDPTNPRDPASLPYSLTLKAFMRLAAEYRAQRTERRLRVGFAAGLFEAQPPIKMFGGWIKHLDRSRFEVHGYQFGLAWDPMRDALRECCDVFRQATWKTTVETWRAQIAADKLDVLIYAEIGITEPGQRHLAAGARLAPVQCATWGRPFTSGLPNIDYFLSSDAMEPANGQSHYTEQLIRLPNLGVCYEPALDSGHTIDRECLSVPPDRTLYLSVQSPWKFAPAHDWTYAAIAAAVPSALIVFMTPPPGSPPVPFNARISEAFAKAGLDVTRYVRVVSRVPSPHFLPLLRAADILLDTFGSFSGGVTAFETLQVERPLMTADLPGARMRGRQSAAILRHIGLGHRVAASADEYVAMAIALTDPDKRAAYRAEIAARKHRLYGDLAPVRALEAFLADAIAAKSSANPPG